MRKFLKVGLCGAAALMMFATGCSGQKSAKDASQAESTAEGETPAETEEYVAEGSITLGEYKGIPVTVTEPTVTDEEVDAQIQQLLNSSAEYLEVDREAQLGDQVNIDYKGMKTELPLTEALRRDMIWCWVPTASSTDLNQGLWERKREKR